MGKLLPTRPRDARPLLGVEHEYELHRDGSKLDMRPLIGAMPLDGVRADPADPLAVQCSVGGVVTADGPEAEIATPPIRLVPGAIDCVLDHVAALESVLDGGLPHEVTRVGYSTHISVEVPDRRAEVVARRLAREWSPALTMLTQHPSSPGLLVRPRWNRVEFGCEHLEGAQLIGAIAFCVAATAAVQRSRTRLPDRGVHLQPSRQRFGWYIDRAECAARGLLDRQALAVAWDVARPYVAELLDRGTISAVDDVVGGREPLPVEVGPSDDPRPPRRAVAHLTHHYRHGELVVAPHQLTWRLAVFHVACGSRVRWLQVPGTHVRQFLGALHRGELDEVLRSRCSRLPLSGFGP